jgi:hypothetical protein
MNNYICYYMAYYFNPQIYTYFESQNRDLYQFYVIQLFSAYNTIHTEKKATLKRFFRKIEGFFPYCPDCPKCHNSPKLQIRFVNLAVDLSQYYLSSVFTNLFRFINMFWTIFYAESIILASFNMFSISVHFG